MKHGGALIVTRLIKGAEEITSECPIMVNDRCKPREFGSAPTYARQYSMAAIVGISADEDDAANAAQHSAANRPSRTRTLQSRSCGRVKFAKAMETDGASCQPNSSWPWGIGKEGSRHGVCVSLG
ncbi:MAG: ERF family protein [Hyphomicrobiales bacterium]